MNYPPYQMNQTTAAKYLCVSVATFKTHYRPHLKQCIEGGVVYFLKTDIEKYCRNRFIKKNLKNRAIKTATPKKKNNSYEEALKKITSNKYG